MHDYLLFQSESISELNGALYRHEYYVVVDVLICVLFNADLLFCSP